MTHNRLIFFRSSFLIQNDGEGGSKKGLREWLEEFEPPAAGRGGRGRHDPGDNVDTARYKWKDSS